MYPDNRPTGQSPNTQPAQQPAPQQQWRGYQYNDQLPHAHDPYADLPAPTNPAGNQAQNSTQPRIGVPKAPIDNYRYGAGSEPVKRKRSHKGLIWAIIGLLMIGGLGAGIYYVYASYEANNTSSENGGGQQAPADAEESLKKALETNLSITTFRETLTAPVPGQQSTKTVVMDHDYSDPKNPMTKGTIRYELPPQDGVTQWRSGDFVTVETNEEFWRLNTYERQSDPASEQAKNLAALKGDWVRYDDAAKSRLVPDALYLPPGMALDKMNTLQGAVPVGYLDDNQRKEIVDWAIASSVYKVTASENVEFGGRPSVKLELNVDMNKLKEMNRKIAEKTGRQFVMDDLEKINKLTVWNDAESGLPQQTEIEYEKSGRTNIIYSNLNQAVVISAPRNVVSEADALKPSTP